MKKLLIPALALLMVLVAALLWWSTRGTAPAGVEMGSSQPSPEESQRASTSLEAQPAELAEASPDGARVKVADAPAPEKPAESWDLDRSQWVTGVVRTSGACADDALEVFALSEETLREELVRRLVREERKGDDDPRSPILSRRAVAPDGTFRVPFPPDLKRGYVSLLGKYVHLSESKAIDLSAGEREMVLDGECGAWLQGELALPLDTSLKVETLDGTKIELRFSAAGSSGDPFTTQGLVRRTQLAKNAFEFRAVPVKPAYTLNAELDTLAALETSVKDLVPGRPTLVRITCVRGGSLRGIVRSPEDAGGAGVAGAEVVAAAPGRWFGFDDHELRKTKSTEGGAFELLAVRPGKIGVKATSPGFLEGEPVKIEVRDGALVSDVVVTLAHGQSVAGTITWAGEKPAAGVEVRAAFDMSAMYGMGAFNALRGREGTAKSDEQGRFEIGGLGKGPFTLQAEALPPGVTIAEGQSKKDALHRARADSVQPGTQDVKLALRAPEGVGGKVIDEAGAPVTKFKVQGSRQGKGPLGNLGQESEEHAFDDPDGHFLFTGLIEGTWKLYVIAEGFGLSDPVDVALPRKIGEGDLVFALVHAASVSGVVRGPGGNPVSSASIDLDTGQANWQARLNSGPKQPTAKSADDGTFVIEGLKPGHAAVVASSKDHARSLALALDLSPGQKLEGAVLLLREGGRLSGEVFNDAGQPAPGMFVQVLDPKTYSQRMQHTDAKGTFLVEHLEPGQWQVVAMPASLAGGASEDSGDAPAGDSAGKSDTENATNLFSKMKIAMVDIADAQETHVVLGAPPADPVDVHGRVTHAGEPYKGAIVSFVTEGKDMLKTMRTTAVGDDGEYKVKLEQPGHYVISVQKFGASQMQQNTTEFSREIPKEKDYRLDLELPTARISGRVSNPTGEPAAGVRVSLQNQSAIESGTMWGGMYCEAATDADGRYDVQALRPGTYTVLAGGMTMGGLFGDDGAPGREAKSDLALSEGEWMKDVDFRLKKAGTIDVEVVDDRGQAVAEAAVFVRNKDGHLLDRLSLVNTDASGHCKYGGLAPGAYTVVARAGTATSAETTPIRVEEGEHKPAHIVLAAGTVLLVTVVNDDSQPIRASVSVQDEQGREVGGMIALAEIMAMFGKGGFSTTEQRVGPLPPGKYRVKASTSDGKSVNKPVTLTGQPERKLVLRFGS